MLAFPNELPKPLNGSLGEKSNPAWIQDRAQQGAGSRRAINSRILRSWTFSLRCNLEKREALLAFHDVDCGLGVAQFVWTHPSTGETVEVQFSHRPEPSHVELHNYIMSVGLEEV